MTDNQPQINSQEQEGAMPAPKLYDADAQQRLPLKVERKGKLYSVSHFIEAISDGDIILLERSKDMRMSEADANETDESDATAVSGKMFGPAIELWEKRASRVEGYALNGSEDDEWKTKIAVGDKSFAILGVALAYQFKSLPVATADELCPPDDDDTSTYLMRAMFDGEVVELRHVLRRATPDEMADFESLMSRTLLVQGTQFGATDQRIPSRARRLGELYRQAQIETGGYAGRVPLHHQMAVALRHFRAQRKIDAGNSQGSPRS